MPRVLLPPEGNDDLSSAHQEDGGNRTGPYLAALSFQYAVTNDPQVKKWADGNRTTPTLNIDGEIIIGWDQERVAELVLKK